MIQVKLAVYGEAPRHAGYAGERPLAPSHLCRRGFPVVLVAGLESIGNHMHGIALARPLPINGFGATSHRLCATDLADDVISKLTNPDRSPVVGPPPLP